MAGSSSTIPAHENWPTTGLRLLATITRQYGRLVWRSFCGRTATPPRQRRSLFFCALVAVAYPVVLAHGLAWLFLDNLVLWWWRGTPLKPPVFIVGNPRSGTTLLHRLMSRDTGRSYCFKTWEIWFPSLLQKWMLDGFGRLDDCLGRPFRKVVERFEHRQFRRFNAMHQLGMFLPEEDDKLFMLVMACIEWGYLFPYVDFVKYARFDDEVPAAERRALMRFYEACVFRQSILRGTHKTFVSKNPWFTGRIASLHECFPEAKIVYLVRNPLDVTASVISIARTMIHLMFGVEPDLDIEEEAYSLIRSHYLQGLSRIDALPPSQRLVVNYQRLIDNPQETVIELYEHFGFPMLDEYRLTLAVETERMRTYRSQHRYSLDATSISPQRVVDDLFPVFQRFGFDTRGLVPTTVS